MNPPLGVDGFCVDVVWLGGEGRGGYSPPLPLPQAPQTGATAAALNLGLQAFTSELDDDQIDSLS